ELQWCSNCASLTHSRCAPSHPLLLFPFVCPLCSDPIFSFFSPPPGPRLSIEAKISTDLLCAAKIAAWSMAEAVRATEEEASRRVKEAVVCRKRVKEALDKVLAVVAMTKKKTVAPLESGKPKSTA
ncbi:unnamed protein product, partial [Linum tenue]